MSAQDGRVLPIVGLAGAPGSGKSAVAELLRGLGGVVVDADRLAREAAEAPEVRDAVRGWWGPGVLEEDGSLDRAAVAAIVFERPGARRRLEGLIHPRVAAGRERIHAEAAADPAARFLVEDCPLLVESGLAAGCDEVWLVEAPFETRRDRVAHRGWDAEQLRRRDAAQASPRRRRAAATRVLRNGGGPADLAAAVADAAAGMGIA
ncbi:dephospho-CoA kinase [Phycisphaera mikurensis]|uniref:Dephospho-CoA kinase n=1 Tax=Phycisphaera mikurensis (strain NBRC 102666 / KCTC 22515 / FYK2301M01) TaxID=1142394 RepID=I0ICA6_PHYMF|nr:dephospho-CoA kinase [Phycisphaera mikurensis]MBB6441887.1 dephospho-CoA kinase [Phycisphaera mikurensis]BAM02894.1 dephospho-CoA kinase [Phycisphaera mikurensis NBRC 102666]